MLALRSSRGQVGLAELGGKLHAADIKLVVGTRPEAIKMGPVARALVRRGARPAVVLTGQQPIDPDEFGLGELPRILLRCPGMPDPHTHALAVAEAIARHLPSTDLLMVQGDTSSAFGAALAAFRDEVPVAHVEAGLRTFDPDLPWPEEEYRVAIDAKAQLLFAPTDVAARNLEREQVSGEIHVTGNSGIDALLELEAELGSEAPRQRGEKLVLVTCHRRESWGEGLKRIAAAIEQIAADPRLRVQLVLHPNSHVAATMREALGHLAHVHLLPPLSYRDLVHRMRDVDLILSDSGGIQEEAPALGTPLLVLREKTERPEGIASGNMRLVGTDTDRIVAEVRELLGDPFALAAMSRKAFPYGDGNAGERIAGIIENRLSPKSSTVSRTLGSW